MKAKRYWVRDLRDDKEYITDAWDKTHLSKKTGIPIDKMQICQTYYNKGGNPDTSLVLLF